MLTTIHVAKVGQPIDNAKRGVYFNNRNGGVDRMPSIALKDKPKKKHKKLLMSFFEKSKLPQTMENYCKKRKEEIGKEKTWVEKRSVACFLDGNNFHLGNSRFFGK